MMYAIPTLRATQDEAEDAAVAEAVVVEVVAVVAAGEAKEKCPSHHRIRIH
jgi:hypothetical protein